MSNFMCLSKQLQLYFAIIYDIMIMLKLHDTYITNIYVIAKITMFKVEIVCLFYL